MRRALVIRQRFEFVVHRRLADDSPIGLPWVLGVILPFAQCGVNALILSRSGASVGTSQVAQIPIHQLPADLGFRNVNKVLFGVSNTPVHSETELTYTLHRIIKIAGVDHLAG